ncbi:MAG: hypothetical protein HETSPECPRED_004174 [Heterodermia speciosa]|uniref:Uncharacterized protein n=1 Tax=Heterodermia speciosa TaxID=116794 RepID=A0A8H3FDQ9_9LECA|nr:MAG: hypothetical protein HETSPECPRED_004174 [Heterodermia speciosa]
MSDRRYVSLSGGPPNDGRPPPPSSPPVPPTVRYVSISGSPPNGGRPPPPAAPPAPPTVHYVTHNGNPPNGGLPPSMIPLATPMTTRVVPAPPVTYVASFPPPPAPQPPAPTPVPVLTYQLVPSAPLPTPVYTIAPAPAPAPSPPQLIKVNLWPPGTQPWNLGGSTARFDQVFFPPTTPLKEVCRAMIGSTDPACRDAVAAVAEVEQMGLDGQGLPRFRKGQVWVLDGEEGGKAIGEVGRGANGEVWLACLV